MKKYIISVLITLLVKNIYSQEHLGLPNPKNRELITANRQGKFYLYPNSIEKNQFFRFAWIELELDKPQKRKSGEIFTSYYYVHMIDCERMAVHSMSIFWYSKFINDIVGAYQETPEEAMVNLRNIETAESEYGTVGWTIAEETCKRH